MQICSTPTVTWDSEAVAAQPGDTQPRPLPRRPTWPHAPSPRLGSFRADSDRGSHGLTQPTVASPPALGLLSTLPQLPASMSLSACRGRQRAFLAGIESDFLDHRVDPSPECFGDHTRRPEGWAVLDGQCTFSSSVVSVYAFYTRHTPCGHRSSPRIHGKMRALQRPAPDLSSLLNIGALTMNKIT
jgi:hypothetical protein